MSEKLTIWRCPACGSIGGEESRVCGGYVSTGEPRMKRIHDAVARVEVEVVSAASLAVAVEALRTIENPESAYRCRLLARGALARIDKDEAA